MRIIQVAHWFLPRHLAGTEIYTYSLAQELSKRHEVHIYCREDGFVDRAFHETDEVYDGLPVRRVYFNLRGLKANPVNQTLIRFKNSTIEQSFSKYLDQVKPDVVHFQHLFKLSASLIPLAKQRGIPVIVTLHDHWFICYNTQLLRPGLKVCSGPLHGLKCAGCAEPYLPHLLRVLLGRLLSPLFRLLSPLLTPLFVFRTAYMRRCLEQANLIITPSAYLKEVFVAHGFSGDSILVSDNGTRPISPPFHPRAFPESARSPVPGAALRQAQDSAFAGVTSPATPPGTGAESGVKGFPGDLPPQSWGGKRGGERDSTEGLRFGYIGTVQQHKGIHVLVEAFNHINQIDDPSVELKIFGDPDIAPGYYALMQRMARHPRIQFPGVFDNAEVGRILAGIDVLVVPSIWPENSPVTIHEAWLAKTPVIASRIGGIPELVQDGVNGFLFTPGDAKGLLSKMCLFIEDRSLLQRLRANIGPVKSIEENAGELEAIYGRLATAGRG